MLSELGKSTAGLLAATLVAVSCGSNAPGGSAPQTTDVERREASPDAPVDELVAGLNDFSVDFSRLAEDGEGNLVFSPASIGVAFAMAHAGAGEATAAAIADVFGFPDAPALHEAMNAVTQQLDEANTDDVIAELANSTWTQDGLEVGSAFLETMAAYHGSGVHTLDFGDAEGSRDLINDWVAERTRDRIPKLLPEDFITEITRIILVNAIYLNAPWAVRFEEMLTSDQPFHLADGSVAEVPTMRHPTMEVASFAQGEVAGNGYVAVDLPFKDRDIAMTIILPDEDVHLDDFEANLDGAGLGAITADLERATVDLSLPRWDVATDVDLQQPLSTLGLPLPGGDLSGIAPGLELEAAVHAANITVHEEGTEAAAATAVGGADSEPVIDETVTMDRPFLFMIRHIETGLPLFYGRVTDPRG